MKPPESTTLDMRYNAIESLEDFLALVKAEQERNHLIDTVMITPEQHDDLLAFAAPKLGLFGGPIKTFYGYKLFTREQD